MATQTHNKTLYLIASKLGLSENEKVLSKAAEFERLLQTKSVAGSNITDTAKVVICLDLAAGMFGVDLDLKSAIKYSGLKSPTYTNTKKVIQNLLELNTDKLTTSILCAALQCTGLQEFADNILEEYQKQAKMEIDLNLPQYVCMAVYQASRITKVKLSKSKLAEKSRLKPSQWAKLEAVWSAFADERYADLALKKKRGRPARTAVSCDQEALEAMKVDMPDKEEIIEPLIEPYDSWRQRILNHAYLELKELEAVENKTRDQEMSPRRSPRKTPQKFSPYKSPSKAKGVRLLFPVDF